MNASAHSHTTTKDEINVPIALGAFRDKTVTHMYYIGLYMKFNTHTRARTHACTHTRARARARTNTHTNTRVHTHTHIQTHTQTHARIYIHVYMYTYPVTPVSRVRFTNYHGWV